eukprot:1341615-Pyramimonas_sp.AAC.1
MLKHPALDGFLGLQPYEKEPPLKARPGVLRKTSRRTDPESVGLLLYATARHTGSESMAGRSLKSVRVVRSSVRQSLTVQASVAQ